jgi:hypothetical protein
VSLVTCRRAIAGLLRRRHRTTRMADQMRIRPFRLRWHAIVIAA